MKAPMADLTPIWTAGDDPAEPLGPWATETEAETYLAEFLARTGLVQVYRQIPGRPLCQRHFQVTKSVRADLLLVPKRALVEAGWSDGVIVIEVKRPGRKTGPGYSQLLDYMNTAWPVGAGICVVPTFGFLFPAVQPHGPLASVLAQQHIGTALVRCGALHLYAGEARVLSISAAGKVTLGETRFGRNLGAR